MPKRVGPNTIEVAPPADAKGEARPSVSATYRNVAAADGLPTSVGGCSTLYEIFNHSVELHPEQKCLGWRPTKVDGSVGGYEWLSYKEVAVKARVVATALANLGFKPKDKLGICSANNVEWMLAVRGAEILSGVIVPIYDSLGESAVEYIINHSGTSVAIVESSKLAPVAKVAAQVKATLRTVVYVGGGDDASAAALRAAGVDVMSWAELVAGGAAGDVTPTPPAPEDVTCIMYTSGTTGQPKGVLQNHRAMVAGVAGARIMLETAKLAVGPSDTTISFLPMAHIFDRIIEELLLSVGAGIGYWRGNVKLLMDDVAALQPTLFVAVPRILERVADTVRHKVEKGSLLKRALFGGAFNYKLFLLKRGLPHKVCGALVDKVVFGKVKSALGGRVRFIVSGGAPLAPHVENFCNVCLAPVLQGYGLTETCAASFIMMPDPRLAYTVGPPLAATEFRLESVPELKYDAHGKPPRGEVCIRSPMLFAGYYKDPEKTAAEFDEDGFFHTGDVGELTPAGALKIIDRKKNIFKLAQGEYIAVEHLEGCYSESDAVEQVWVYGNSLESSLVAVVVPAARWLDSHGGEAAAGSPEVKKALLDEVTKAGKGARLKGFEMVRDLVVETEPFSVDNDLMTPSMKLKRPQLQRKYQPQIDAMYRGLKEREAAARR